jgi:amino acid transporter
MTAPSGLARKSIGTGSLFFFCVGASGPLITVAGGVVATYGQTGVIGVPLSFLVLAGALAFFTVGYVAMVRYVPHAATFYALLARGLGRPWGVAAGTVALVSYNSIQISLYGLLGVTIQQFLGTGTWWLWALVGWLVVGGLGVLHVNVNARVLTVLLICEIGIIMLFDVASFTHPAQGLTFTPLSPGSLLVNGIGGVFAFGIAAFLGYETGPFYAEEARGHRVVSRASFGALAFIGVFYAVSSWAMAVTVGVQPVGTGAGAAPGVVDAARQQDVAPIPLQVLQTHYGFALAKLGNLLLITSIVAAMISVHNSVARYVFAMARERVLPARLGRIRDGARGGAPVGGSLLQSAVALVVVVAFVVTGADPLKTLFTWLATLAAMGVMLLMFGTSLATIGFFRRGGGSGETAWQRLWAPAVGSVVLATVFVVTIFNLNSLLGTDPGSLRTWIPLGVLVAAVLVGLGWAQAVRSGRPEVYRNIGAGEPEPLAVLEHALANVKV